MIAGLGSQLFAWSDEICENLAEKGFFIITFDDHVVGLLTKFKDADIPDMVEISVTYTRGKIPKIPSFKLLAF